MWRGPARYDVGNPYTHLEIDIPLWISSMSDTSGSLKKTQYLCKIAAGGYFYCPRLKTEEALHVSSGTQSNGKSWSDSSSRTHTGHRTAGDAGSLPDYGLACHNNRFHSHSDRSHRALTPALYQWNPVLYHLQPSPQRAD